MSTKAAIEIKDLAFSYGNKRILKNFDLKVRPGSICCLVGSSGSGKTTTLRLINGLLRPQQGDIFLHGEKLDFAKAEEARRKMGYSIQGSGLFPHMNLFENLTIIAKKQKWSEKKMTERAHELCELMSLPTTKAFFKKKPRQISGGQQQRVGIARALFLKPQIMLMDEPFSALDPITRSELQQEFLRLQEKLGLTIVLVTHDLSEAFSMADDIVLLNQGQIEQQGRPSRFLLAPASQYVKEFMDSHSPGKLLKEIFLYSVTNTNIYTSEKKDNQVLIKHLENEDTQSFQTIEQATDFLKNRGQGAHYWVEDQYFKSGQIFGETEKQDCLKSATHILNGMSALLKTQSSAIPVVNSQNKIIGVFSEEALNAL